MVELSGGSKLEAALAEIAKKVTAASEVSVGFLADATYPDGKSVAMVAAIQEFGGNINIPAHETTIYRQTNKAGTGFNKNGRFVRKDKSNFATTHMVEAHTITIPPRPFFRSMIQEKSPEWPDAVATALKDTGYNARRTLKKVGAALKGQLQASIAQFDSVPLAPRTVAQKGNDKQLVDTGVMLRSVGYRVD